MLSVLARRALLLLLAAALLACGSTVGPTDARTDDAPADVRADAAPAPDAPRDGTADAPAFDIATRDTVAIDGPPPLDAPADVPATPDDALDAAVLDDRAPAPDAPRDGAADAASNARCSAATVVTDGARLIGQSTAGAADAITACAPDAAGSVVYYRATVPPGNALFVQASVGVALRVLGACGASTCLASSSGTPAVFYTNRGAPPQDVVIAVGGTLAGTPVTFDLAVSIRPPPGNVACGAATPVTDGTLLRDQNLAFATETSAACDRAATGDVLYYSATIPAGQTLVARVTPPAGAPAWQSVLRLTDGCTATSCLAHAGILDGGVLIYTNAGSAPRSVVLSVGSFSGGPGAALTFDLSISIGAGVPSTACAAAPVVTDGTVLRAQSTDGITEVSTACATSATGGVRYYSVTVPAGQVLDAEVTRTAGAVAAQAVIRVLDGCAATSCLAYTRPVAPPIVVYANHGTTARTVILQIGSDSSASPITFDLAVSIRRPAANAACATATPVTDGAVLAGEDSGAATDPATCATAFGPGGNVLYYSATIPAGYTLAVLDTSAVAGFGDRVSLLDACGATTCLDYTGRTANPLVYTNTGTSPRSVIIAVGSPVPDAPARFDLRVAIRPPPTNTTCAAATPVADGAVLRLQDARAATELLTTRCLASATGGVLYYRATIPPGQVMTALVTPVTFYWNPVIRLLDGCAAPACTAEADTLGSSYLEYLTYRNGGGAPMDVVLAVGSASATAAGLFDLTVSIAPPPYTETPIAAACEDLSTALPILRAAPLEPGGTATAGDALPFAFELAGASMGAYAMSWNGYLQLFASTASYAYALGQPDNQPIPSPLQPNALVAPYWDQLVAPATSSATGSARTFGTAPNRHLTVQWDNWVSASGGGPLRFQARLYETTNVIEFHYCSLGGAGGMSTGASATIGVESATGLRGTQHSYNTAMSIATGGGIRFTPAP